MLEFKSLCAVPLKIGSMDCTEYGVKNPTDCSDWSHLIGKSVKIDDKTYVIKGVHSYATMRHYAGEKIGLVVLDNSVSTILT